VRDRWPALQAALARVAGPAVELAGDLRQWGWVAHEALLGTHTQRVVAGVGDWFRRRTPCTAADRPPPRPRTRRILVEVAGIGSTSVKAAVDDVDATALGYAPGDVIRFSYDGGRVPIASGRAPLAPELAAIPATSYTVAESQQDLVIEGRRLADLLGAVARNAPGVPIDVVAHSQGGVVARLALDEASVGHPVPSDVHTLVLLGSPQHGADLAAVAAAGRAARAGAAVEDAIRLTLGVDLDPTSPAAGQLAATSDVVRHLEASPPPPGVAVTSVGAAGDLIVTANRTSVSGPAAFDTIVPLFGPTAHDRLPGSSAATREIGLAIAGLPPTCRGLAQVTVDLVTSESLSWGESSIAAGLRVALR
jgi:hypothetical protein